ncbi:helix-turn-helix domain-containing protein [Pedobacter sp. Leaf170]|uniref:helix-turn-helix domain-containing protein n=1 Tax=Pedobacter sp. Leaf170 TaxID=2876558 RepID=UPI001E490173|nr:helix-turn-helix transcriptional regulator [Pedobacter sp. Leaf170]
MDIGKTIKETRISKGFKQNDFAQKCDLTQAYLSKIESNQKEPALSVLKTIAQNLGVPLPVLFFLSLTTDDIDPKKQDSFDMLLPSIKGLISNFF